MFKPGQRVRVRGGNGDTGTIEFIEGDRAFVSFANYNLDDWFDLDQLVLVTSN